MHRLIKTRLMAMMFLQFFIWGAWYATGGNYMRQQGMTDEIYLAYMASPIGSIVAPFFLGMIADRFFAVQKVLGFMHVLSGVFVFLAPFAAERIASTPLFLALLLLHMLCYMPTVGLAMATSFHLLPNKEREFPRVRMFGTLGWIAAGIIVSRLLQGDTTALPMYISGIGGMLMGVYCFLTLPNVPPPGAGKRFSVRDIIGLDALKYLNSRSFIVFIMSVMLTSIPLATYFAYVPLFLRDASVANPAFKMTFGQMSEVFFLMALPWFFTRLGVKGVLIAGMTAWIVRYALFALGAPAAVTWMLIFGILLHGPCYDFVYVAGQVYIDRRASVAIRAQAQGLFVLATYGVGQGLGTIAAGLIFNSIMAGTSGTAALDEWVTFWIVPLVFAVAVLIWFVSGFRDESSAGKTGVVVAAH
jgi:nucleoside transporter